MKSLQRPLVILAIGLTLFSCKKSDLKDTASVNAVSIADSTATASTWTTLSNWNKVDREHFAVYVNNIADSKITAANAEKGLVLVYMKNATDGSAVRLPFEEKVGTATKYWYYQITEGNILVSCDVTGTSELGATNEFGHVVFSGDALKALEEKGITKTNVLKMNFPEAVKNAASN